MAERVDLDHLERLAKAATPGLWLPGDGERVPSDVVSAPDATRDGFDDEDYAHYGGALVAESMRPADREYIAAADPATVLALVAELRAARRERKALRSALERTRDNFAAAVRGLPVRDMAETLAEADASLAYDPAAGHAEPSTHDRSEAR